jgi:nucleotide-binding universal stress UspA family protein
LIKKILVAIDGSKQSDKALDFALDLAKRYSAEIVLVNVLSPSLMAHIYNFRMYIPDVDYSKYLKPIKMVHEKLLSEAFKKAKNFQETLKVSKELHEGRPAEKIVEIAKKDVFDLIVVGDQGLGGIKGFFLGSVSDRVADKSSCPVLIVK